MSVILFLCLFLFAGYIFGKWNEDNHLQDLERREKKLGQIPERNTGKKETFNDVDGVLVSGGVVVAQDAFKSFIAGIVALFGGRIAPYESLMLRARREAVLRAKEQAKALGAKELVHVRIDISAVGFSSNKKQGQSSSVEVFCYATALIPRS